MLDGFFSVLLIELKLKLLMITSNRVVAKVVSSFQNKNQINIKLNDDYFLSVSMHVVSTYVIYEKD